MAPAGIAARRKNRIGNNWTNEGRVSLVRIIPPRVVSCQLWPCHVTFTRRLYQRTLLVVGSQSLPSLLGRSVKIRLRFVPRLLAYQGTYHLPNRVVIREMNATVEARESGLLRRLAEGRERHRRIDGRDPRLDVSETAG